MLIDEREDAIFRGSCSGNRARARLVSFVFLLLPSVLSELDDLKINHRNEEVRENTKAAIRRIKGWRNQGSLRDGVVYDKSITIRAMHQDPKMSESLPWLDADVRDDRIIARALEAQKLWPGAIVVLVAGDINLLNKADAAAINIAEYTDA